MSDHVWELRGGASVQTSSMPATDMALFQCHRCGLCATKRLTNKQECDSAVIQYPDVDEGCME